MKEYWEQIKARLEQLSKLDPTCDLVYGSNIYRYKSIPPVTKKVIEDYERIHLVTLPESYRSYLQYYGAGGFGPDGGISTFPDNVHQKNLSKPLNLHLFEGYLFMDGNEQLQSLTDLDGMLRIGAVGEHSIYLVVSGPLVGYVVCWNGGSVACISGPFDKWYERWIDCAFIAIKNYEFMKRIEIGANFEEQLDAHGMVANRISNKNIVRFKCTEGSIELNEHGRVTKVNFVLPVAKRGFELWPFIG